MEQVNKLILNMLVTKNLDNKLFDYIDSLGETLAYIVWEIMASYYRTIKALLGQSVFGKEMISNLASFLCWKVITDGKQRQVDIDNARENDRQFMHECIVGDLVYVEMT